MKIIGSTTSPFTRITRVVCEELGLGYEFEITPPFAKLDNSHDSFIGMHNPLRRVPILISQDVEIIDSRFIVQFLLTKHERAADLENRFQMNLEQEKILTVIYGTIDAGILWFVLRASHPEIDPASGYMARSRERVENGLNWVDQQPSLGETFGIPEIALVCGLEWLKKRSVFSFERFPNITRIYRQYCDKASLVKTRIPDSA